MSTPFDPQPGPVATVVPATAGQLRYIADLFADRDMSGQGDKYIARASAVRMAIKWATDTSYKPKHVADLISAARNTGEAVNMILAEVGKGADVEDGFLWAPVTRTTASSMIAWLQGLPRKNQAKRPIETLEQWQEDERINDLATTPAVRTVSGTPQGYVPSPAVVPAGRYAVATEDGAINELAFYKVDRPTEGKWAGYVFVQHVVGGDEQRMSFAASKTILAKIAAVGAEAASARYGQELEHCGVCGRPLTNDDSRARGIGPKCAADMGW